VVIAFLRLGRSCARLELSCGDWLLNSFANGLPGWGEGRPSGSNPMSPNGLPSPHPSDISSDRSAHCAGLLSRAGKPFRWGVGGKGCERHGIGANAPSPRLPNATAHAIDRVRCSDSKETPNWIAEAAPVALGNGIALLTKVGFNLTGWCRSAPYDGSRAQSKM